MSRSVHDVNLLKAFACAGLEDSLCFALEEARQHPLLVFFGSGVTME